MRHRLVVRAAITFVAASAGFLLPSAASAADLRLIDAVKRGESVQVRALLKERVDVNAPQPDGTTAIHWAAYHDDAGTVEMLVRAGANANAATDAGVTPLWLACSTNASASTIRLLLDGGADPNRPPNTGETPLMWCARVGNVEAVKTLLSRGARVDARDSRAGQTALMWAAAARHAEVVKTLIEVGADPHARTQVTSELVYTGFRYITAPPANAKGIIVTMKRGGFTPLLFAAQQGDRESAGLLLSAGADVNDADASGASALVIAAHSGHGTFAQLLLDRGADANAAGAGYTALHAAVLRGDAGLIKALLARGANPDALLAAGTPVRKYGVDYALSSAWLGATPYWLAAKFAEVEIMRVLAEAKADTRLAIADGTTPLMATLMTAQGQGDRRERFQTEVQMAAAAAAPAQETATVDAATIALQAGADVNATNGTGDTAVHLAAARGLIPVIKLLASGGANLEVKNKRGQTPLSAAASRRRPGDVEADAAAVATATSQTNPTVELLRSLGAQN